MGTRITIDDLRDKADDIRGDNYSYEFHAGRNGRMSRPGFLVKFGNKEKLFNNMRECLSWMEGFEVGRKEAQIIK